MKDDDAKKSKFYIYYEEATEETVTEYEPFDMNRLIGEVGGFLGLFLGFSVYDVLAEMTRKMEK